MAIRDLLQTTYKDLQKMSMKELKSSFKAISHALRERGKTFAKHGEQAPRYQKGLGSMRGADKMELSERIAKAAAYMRGKASTYRGHEEVVEDRRKKMQEAMPDMDFSTKKKLKEFGEFMDEMLTRFPDHRQAFPSSNISDIYREAKRLNVDPRTFMKNLSFWETHISDLEKARPIERTGRPVYPSDYARQLKLGKIRE